MGMNAILVFFFHGTAEGVIEAVYVAPIVSTAQSRAAGSTMFFHDGLFMKIHDICALFCGAER